MVCSCSQINECSNGGYMKQRNQTRNTRQSSVRYVNYVSETSSAPCPQPSSSADPYSLLSMMNFWQEIPLTEFRDVPPAGQQSQS
jgi:hypothetical protein